MSIIYVINISLELFVSRPDVLTYISIFIPVGEYYSCNLYLTRTTCGEPDVLGYICIFIPVGEYYSCHFHLTRTACE